MNEILSHLRKLKKTLFTSQDIALLLGIPYLQVRNKVAYYCKKWYLRRVHNGIFAFWDDQYDLLDLAGQVLRPSYISLDTVLRREGVIFQYDSTVTVISYKTLSMTIDKKNIRFHACKKNILYADNGIVQHAGYAIATKERAFMDALYLDRRRYFDHVWGIDWSVCDDLVFLYGSAAFAKTYFLFKKKHAQ